MRLNNFSEKLITAQLMLKINNKNKNLDKICSIAKATFNNNKIVYTPMNCLSFRYDKEKFLKFCA